MKRIHDLLDDTSARMPNQLAIRDIDGRNHSFADLAKAVGAAADLLQRADVQPGDRVAVIGGTSLSTAVFILACSRIGAWVVPINARMTDTEIETIFAHAQPMLVVACEGVMARVSRRRILSGLTVVTGSFGTVGWAPVPKQASASPADGISPELRRQVAVLIYTTGTTGNPKGVMLTHQNLIAAGQASTKRRGFGPRDLIYTPLPLTHAFGLAALLMASLWSGASLWFSSKLNPRKALEALDRGVTALPAVPQIHAALIAYAQSRGRSTLNSPDLRYVSSGAAPLDLAAKQAAEAFYGIAMQNGYGMTETSAGISGTNGPLGSADLSVGAPFGKIEVVIKGADENERGVGEIWVRGEIVTPGYYRNPEANKAAFSETGFLKTGDLGHFDDMGNLHIVGRKKELIIRSGFSVYPPEVEGAINEHAAVLQSAVLGARNATGNEDILAFVQTLPGHQLDQSELKQFLSQRLAAFKRPTHFFFVDRMPTAENGKILKHKLPTLIPKS